MTAIAGTLVNRLTFTITAASSGDATTIAALFNGTTFPSVATASATATASSATVTLYWDETKLLAGTEVVYQFVANAIKANTALTSPITFTYNEQASIT